MQTPIIGRVRLAALDATDAPAGRLDTPPWVLTEPGDIGDRGSRRRGDSPKPRLETISLVVPIAGIVRGHSRAQATKPLESSPTRTGWPAGRFLAA